MKTFDKEKLVHEDEINLTETVQLLLQVIKEYYSVPKNLVLTIRVFFHSLVSVSTSFGDSLLKWHI